MSSWNVDVRKESSDQRAPDVFRAQVGMGELDGAHRVWELDHGRQGGGNGKVI